MNLFRSWCFSLCLFLILAFLGVSALGSETGFQQPYRGPLNSAQEQPILSTPGIDPTQDSTLPALSDSRQTLLYELHSALDVLQTDFFALWLGIYPTAIDWTAAVTTTHLAATLSSFSDAISSPPSGTTHGRLLTPDSIEHLIIKYFDHLIALYYTQDTLSLRTQAYDDILWVVLSWLDSLNLIRQHAGTKKSHPSPSTTQFIPPFAHRARVFYELAEQGWDTRLCGGGMVWNPRLAPYKNAITNQLWISASVGMYLHFPGDDNDAPFGQPGERDAREPRSTYDARYLEAAVRGYDWLVKSNMTNEEGLYTDGFHISGGGTKCDVRNEDVWTYNQGVILSGLRGLWEATGNVSYLHDGHELVRNVLRATGWLLSLTTTSSGDLGSGFDVDGADGDAGLKDGEGVHAEGMLGKNGILTEKCDESGSCNQDAQAFKGIFVHHLTAFCAPLPTVPVAPGKTHAADRVTFHLHKNSCRRYTSWVVRNAAAAMKTRDGRGRFGAWWGARKGDGTGDPNDRGRGRTVESMGGGVAVVKGAWEFVRESGRSEWEREYMGTK